MLSPVSPISLNSFIVLGCVPSIVVWCGSDASTSEYCLALEKHFLARGKDVAIGDHQISRNRRLGHNDEQLVAEPHGVYLAEHLGPLVKHKLRVVG